MLKVGSDETWLGGDFKEVPSLLTALEQMLRRRRDDQHRARREEDLGLGRKLGEHADIGPTAEDGAPLAPSVHL